LVGDPARVLDVRPRHSRFDVVVMTDFRRDTRAQN
jgi:hypothetical protein